MTNVPSSRPILLRAPCCPALSVAGNLTCPSASSKSKKHKAQKVLYLRGVQVNASEAKICRMVCKCEMRLYAVRLRNHCSGSVPCVMCRVLCRVVGLLVYLHARSGEIVNAASHGQLHLERFRHSSAAADQRVASLFVMFPSDCAVPLHGSLRLDSRCPPACLLVTIPTALDQRPAPITKEAVSPRRGRLPVCSCPRTTCTRFSVST